MSDASSGAPNTLTTDQVAQLVELSLLKEESSAVLPPRKRRKIVRFGDEITITTPDPIHLPLPDEELLRLQWILHRLAALCAAAGFFFFFFFFF